MPRRIPDYPDAYLGWNQIASVGSYITFYSILFFIVSVWLTFFKPVPKSLHLLNFLFIIFRINSIRTLFWKFRIFFFEIKIFYTFWDLSGRKHGHNKAIFLVNIFFY
jgi:hypothetical protein